MSSETGRLVLRPGQVVFNHDHPEADWHSQKIRYIARGVNNIAIVRLCIRRTQDYSWWLLDKGKVSPLPFKAETVQWFSHTKVLVAATNEWVIYDTNKGEQRDLCKRKNVPCCLANGRNSVLSVNKGQRIQIWNADFTHTDGKKHKGLHLLYYHVSGSFLAWDSKKPCKLVLYKDFNEANPVSTWDMPTRPSCGWILENGVALTVAKGEDSYLFEFTWHKSDGSNKAKLVRLWGGSRSQVRDMVACTRSYLVTLSCDSSFFGLLQLRDLENGFLLAQARLGAGDLRIWWCDDTELAVGQGCKVLRRWLIKQAPDKDRPQLDGFCPRFAVKCEFAGYSPSEQLKKVCNAYLKLDEDQWHAVQRYALFSDRTWSSPSALVYDVWCHLLTTLPVETQLGLLRYTAAHPEEVTAPLIRLMFEHCESIDLAVIPYKIAYQRIAELKGAESGDPTRLQIRLLQALQRLPQLVLSPRHVVTFEAIVRHAQHSRTVRLTDFDASTLIEQGRQNAMLFHPQFRELALGVCRLESRVSGLEERVHRLEVHFRQLLHYLRERQERETKFGILKSVLSLLSTTLSTLSSLIPAAISMGKLTTFIQSMGINSQVAIEGVVAEITEAVEGPDAEVAVQMILARFQPKEQPSFKDLFAEYLDDKPSPPTSPELQPGKAGKEEADEAGS